MTGDSIWIFTTMALASALTLVVTGAMLYSVYEIVGERMAFWDRGEGK